MVCQVYYSITGINQRGLKMENIMNGYDLKRLTKIIVYALLGGGLLAAIVFVRGVMNSIF